MKNVVGIVLAAGFGSRLRPATLHCPKPLLPVAGLEPLYSALCRLSEAGVTKVVVNAHHLAPRILAKLKEWGPRDFPDLEIRSSVESPAILGSGGGVLKILQEVAADWARDSRVVILNGDTLTDLSPSDLLGTKSPNTAAQFSFSRSPSHLERYGPVWIAEKGGSFVYRGVGSQNPVTGAEPAHFLGIHILEAEAVNRLLDKSRFAVRDVDLFSGIYEPLIAEGLAVRGQEFFRSGDGRSGTFWFDLNTAEYLLEAQRWLLESLSAKESFWRRALLRRFPSLVEATPGVWTNARGPISAKISAPSVVALDSHTRLDARVGRYSSLVGHVNSVPEGWEIENASVLFDSEVSAAADRRSVSNEVLVVT